MATETEMDIGLLIRRTPGVRGGRPYVAEAGVTVRRIVTLRYGEGLTPEQITEDMPHLTLAGVYAALAYYHSNQERLDADFASEEAEEKQILDEWTRSRSQENE